MSLQWTLHVLRQHLCPAEGGEGEGRTFHYMPHLLVNEGESFRAILHLQNKDNLIAKLTYKVVEKFPSIQNV